MSLKDKEHKEAWFLKINPNGRAPAMVDPNQNDLVIFETGAQRCTSTNAESTRWQWCQHLCVHPPRLLNHAYGRTFTLQQSPGPVSRTYTYLELYVNSDVVVLYRLHDSLPGDELRPRAQAMAQGVILHKFCCCCPVSAIFRPWAACHALNSPGRDTSLMMRLECEPSWLGGKTLF